MSYSMSSSNEEIPQDTQYVYLENSMSDLKPNMFKKIPKSGKVFVKNNIKLYIELSNNYHEYGLQSEFQAIYLSNMNLSL